jgi:hypothetical protein
MTSVSPLKQNTRPLLISGKRCLSPFPISDHLLHLFLKSRNISRMGFNVSDNYLTALTSSSAGVGDFMYPSLPPENRLAIAILTAYLFIVDDLTDSVLDGISKFK